MRSIAIMSRKGGAGKTTLAVNLAIMGHLLGLPTLLVDSDPQRAATLVLRARKVTGPDVLTAGAGKLFQAALAGRREGLRFMVVDTPVAPEGDIVQAVNCAHLTLIVCRPTVLDINAAVQSAEMLRQLGKAGAIVLNQAPRSRLDDPAVRRAMKALKLAGLPIIGTLSFNGLYQKSLDEGRSVAELESGACAVTGELEDLWCSIEHLMARSREVANPEPVRSPFRRSEIVAPQFA